MYISSRSLPRNLTPRTIQSQLKGLVTYDPAPPFKPHSGNPSTLKLSPPGTYPAMCLRRY
jgi:hypothetical protein